MHYLFEPGSFIPLAQVHTDAIQGVKVPAWSQHNPYDPDRDPLLKAGPEPSAPRAVYYYHADHLGTPQALTDAQGQLALEMDYQAWGEAREVIAEAAASAGIRNPFRFQGQYHDDESGLHYNRHRYYDPEIGRFISRDPIGLLGGINTHSYAPNPVEWVDPFGLERFGSGKGKHTATVEVINKNGNVKSCQTLQSGSMTPEEKELGFPRSTLATHTENRAMRQVDIASGDVVNISGEYPPCTSCKGAMNKKAKEVGCVVNYSWPEGSWSTKK